jgi:hypothetical protein
MYTTADYDSHRLNLSTNHDNNTSHIHILIKEV